MASAPAAGLHATADDANASSVQNESNNSESNLGASISAFMQASTAEAEGDVENGMFEARFESASNESQEKLVQSRTGTLQERLDALRDQRAALLNSSDELSIAERAKASRLTAQVEALQTAIDTASEAAKEVGADGTTLNHLRENASTLSGPEVAALATGLVTNDGRPGAVNAGQGIGGNGTPEGNAAENADAAQGNPVNDAEPAEQSDNRANASSNSKSDDAGSSNENAAEANVQADASADSSNSGNETSSSSSNKSD